MGFLGDFGKPFSKGGLLDDISEKVIDPVINFVFQDVVDPTLGRVVNTAGNILDARLVSFSSDKLGIDRVDVTLTNVLAGAIVGSTIAGIIATPTASVTQAVASSSTGAVAGAPVGAGAGLATTGAATVGAGAVAAGGGLVQQLVQGGVGVAKSAVEAKAQSTLAFYAFAAFVLFVVVRK